jgi:hypothetical protein
LNSSSTPIDRFCDRLRIQIIDGYFRCQYSTVYPDATRGLIWTTKHQRLTLDSEKYHKGDLIKGKIEFECVEEPTDPEHIERAGRYVKTIKLYGVFKTIVQ